MFQIDSGAATNLHYVGLPGSAAAAAGGTTTASTVVGTFNGTKTAGVNKSAWAYAANDMAGSFNGGAVVTDATGAMPAGLTTVRFGKLVAATMWSGYLRKMTYYNGRMSNADLVTLTTFRSAMPDTPVGTNSPDYTLTSADLGATIYCKVTATNASGTANADSNTVGPVTAAAGLMSVPVRW